MKLLLLFNGKYSNLEKYSSIIKKIEILIFFYGFVERFVRFFMT